MDVDQLERAVSIVLQGDADASLKQQALDYCNSVKNSADGWRASLGLIAEGTQRRREEAVFFAYQILDAAVYRLQSGELALVREKLWHYLTQIIVPDAYEEPVHIRNKLAQTFAYVFTLTYGSAWPSYFTDLQNLANGSDRGTDIYLRVLKAVHEEIGDTLILRDAETVQRNNALKDQIRAADMAQLINSWFTILDRYSGRDDAKALEILDGVLKVIGGWVSWIDITLLLGNGALQQLVFKQFAVPKLRLTTLDAIGEIVSKKMFPAAKLELIESLNLTQLLRDLPAESTQDLELDERVARTTNLVALELLRIAEDGPSAQVEPKFVELMPTILSYLANEYDDTSLQVVPAINEYLQQVRREVSKIPDNMQPRHAYIPQERVELLKVILEHVVKKSAYDADLESAPDDEDDEADFFELRSKLKVLQEQIASIHLELYVGTVEEFVHARLTSTGGPLASWQQTELALYELGVLGEALKAGSVRAAKRQDGAAVHAEKALQRLFATMVESPAVTTSRQAPIQLWYMELAYRHASFYSAKNPALLKATLDVFLSPLGIQHRELRVRVRGWYLLLKWYRAVRKELQSGLAGEPLAPHIFTAVAPLLRIEAKLPEADSGSPDSDSDASKDDGGIFDYQLNLFELCGMVLADGSEKGDESDLITRFLANLFDDIRRSVDLSRTTSDAVTRELQFLKVHHAIMAFGTFSRGMQDAAPGPNFAGSATAAEMRRGTDMVVAVLEQLGSIALIREAARFTISRLVVLLGSSIIGEVSRLINTLLNNVTTEELGDFLSFLGLLAHSFREDAGVFEMFTSLCSPLFEGVLQSLQQVEGEAASGSTDSQLVRKELVRTYLQLVFNLLNNNHGAIFLVDRNRSAFERVFGSILHYAANYEHDVANQKLAIADLGKMVQLWGTGKVAAGQFGEGERVALFDAPDVFTRLTELCWTMMLKQDFSLKDAQTKLVVMELGALQKAMWDARGQWYGDLVLKYLGGIGLPAQLASEFVGELARLASKDFKRYFYDFLVRAQG